MKLTIKCTEEHLESAKYCDIVPEKLFTKQPYFDCVESNCWIAVACHDIFPYCSVDGEYITNLRRIDSPFFKDQSLWQIELPRIARVKIVDFDNCKIENQGEVDVETSVDLRLRLKPFEFNIEITPEALDFILIYENQSLKEITDIIEKAPHLELI